MGFMYLLVIGLIDIDNVTQYQSLFYMAAKHFEILNTPTELCEELRGDIHLFNSPEW